jgi:hypothetical protein
MARLHFYYLMELTLHVEGFRLECEILPLSLLKTNDLARLNVYNLIPSLSRKKNPLEF